jgi:ABC-type uncharacterized transport system substrate-binding protein
MLLKIFTNTVIGSFVQSLLFAVAFLCIHGQGHAGSRPIAIVHSYHEEFKWVKEVNKGILDYIEGKELFGIEPDREFGKREFKYYYMNAKEHQNDEKYLVNKGQEIIKELNSINPIVTIISDDEALKYVAAPLRGHSLHRFVFLGVNNDPRDYGVVSNYASPEYNITGLISEHPFLYSIRLIKEIFPGAKNIYIFFDDSMSGKGIYNNLKRHLDQMDDSTKKMVRDTLISNKWTLWKKMMLRNQRKDNVFIIGTFYTLHDSMGQYVSEKDVIDWIVSHSNVPELTVVSSHISDGLLLSISNPGFVHGYEACHLSSGIIAGTSISNIPIALPKQKAVHVNMDRAKQIGAIIPVDIIVMSRYFEELGY